MKKEFVLTKDGSHSIYLPEIDEHYHSINGSITESNHIFVDSGLLEIAKSKKQINILEVGMGTGLNVLTSYLASKKKGLIINYFGIEAYPLDWLELKTLNFSNLIEGSEVKEVFHKIHSIDWKSNESLCKNFKLNKIHSKIQNYKFEPIYDLCYFDAFAPEKQEEMWDELIFENIFENLVSGGILVTYCVKGIIRRRLKKIGFRIEKLPGPIGGKREILRAWKD